MPRALCQVLVDSVLQSGTVANSHSNRSGCDDCGVFAAKLGKDMKILLAKEEFGMSQKVGRVWTLQAPHHPNGQRQLIFCLKNHFFYCIISFASSREVMRTPAASLSCPFSPGRWPFRRPKTGCLSWVEDTWCVLCVSKLRWPNLASAPTYECIATMRVNTLTSWAFTPHPIGLENGSFLFWPFVRHEHFQCHDYFNTPTRTCFVCTVLAANQLWNILTMMRQGRKWMGLPQLWSCRCWGGWSLWSWAWKIQNKKRKDTRHVREAVTASQKFIAKPQLASEERRDRVGSVLIWSLGACKSIKVLARGRKGG